MTRRMIQILKWLLRYFDPNARCRDLDLRFLWPDCVALAPNLDQAKAAFACHAFNDPAWMILGQDAVDRFIEHLAPETRSAP